jgi:signal transduction histidine kinase
LYLAKRVVAGHGGSIIFSSKEGKGSTFGFSVPLKRLRVDDKANKLEYKPGNN